MTLSDDVNVVHVASCLTIVEKNKVQLQESTVITGFSHTAYVFDAVDTNACPVFAASLLHSSI
jgi:hypothetical protein